MRIQSTSQSKKHPSMPRNSKFTCTLTIFHISTCVASMWGQNRSHPPPHCTQKSPRPIVCDCEAPMLLRSAHLLKFTKNRSTGHSFCSGRQTNKQIWEGYLKIPEPWQESRCPAPASLTCYSSERLPSLLRLLLILLLLLLRPPPPRLWQPLPHYTEKNSPYSLPHMDSNQGPTISTHQENLQFLPPQVYPAILIWSETAYHTTAVPILHPGLFVFPNYQPRCKSWWWTASTRWAVSKLKLTYPRKERQCISLPSPPLKQQERNSKGKEGRKQGRVEGGGTRCSWQFDSTYTPGKCASKCVQKGK